MNRFFETHSLLQVCNKCGLYERTHLRPRPHRFDELRAGSKARKAAKVASSPNTSPKAKQDPIKKEPHEGEYDLSACQGMFACSLLYSSLIA